MWKVCPTQALAVAVIIVGLAHPAAGQGKPSRLDQPLSHAASGGSGGSIEVIIRTVPEGQDPVRAMLAGKGHGLTAEHPLLHALSATVDVRDLADLERNPFVISVSLDAAVHAHQAPASPDSLVMLNALRPILGSTTLTGNGVGVAVMIVLLSVGC